MIEFVAINDDLRLQFCCDSRPGMKRRCFVHGAIIRRSDIWRHLVCVRVLEPVESDVGLGPRTHYKGSSENYLTRKSSAPSLASTWTVWPSRTLPSRIS